MLTNKWSALTCLLPDNYVLYVTAKVVSKRLIYGFGGYGIDDSLPAGNTERFLRLDTLKVHNGW